MIWKKGRKRECEEESELVIQEETNVTEEKTIDFHKGRRFSIKEKRSSFWRNVEILSRAGKTG